MQAALAERPSTLSPERANIVNLCEFARQQLELHPHFRGRCSGLTFEQRGRALRISGRLPSYYLKQLVQETLRHIPGVQSVHNDIDVVRSDGFVAE